jgi:pSer/pThr/pTyr-binding forkhead associated (FHA) protein
MQNTTTHQATLLIKLHGRSSEELPLASEALTIGRKADNHLVIEDAAVSGHHARIVRVQAVYFIEDLGSTNGTMVNDKPIDRRQLRDTDIITIGRHRLIFRDTGPAMDSTAAPDELDHTMVLSRQAPGTDLTQLTPSVRVLAGRTARPEYAIAKHVTTIGADAQATIRLTSWFAPKQAATITRRTIHYLISSGQNGKPVLVNGKLVSVEQQLKDGDRIEVAGITLLWKSGAKKIV